MSAATQLSMSDQWLHAAMCGAIFSAGDMAILGVGPSIGKFGVSTVSEYLGQYAGDMIGDATNQNDYAGWLRKYVLPGLASGAIYVAGSKITGVDGRSYMKPFLLQAGSSMVHQATMGTKGYQKIASSWAGSAPVQSASS